MQTIEVPVTTMCPLCHLEPAEKYCQECDGRFNKALEELGNLRKKLEGNESFMAQFASYREFVDYFVFESLIRLSSPFDGKLYESITTLKDALGFGRQSVVNSLKRLEERGMIAQFDVDKKNIANRNIPILMVSNCDEPAVPVYDYYIGGNNE